MTSEELIKKVRKIEIKTRGLSRNIFAGEYHSQYKGKGMAFSEVREYAPGDDVRSIDWNVTARLNKPYIKVFEEEREMTVMLLVDVSGSRNFGTVQQTKRDMIAEIAATLAFSTIANNDKVGVIFFSNKVEKYIPPKKGRSHVLRIIRELIDFEPVSPKTDITRAIEYFANAQKRRCVAFLISDFMDDRFLILLPKKKKSSFEQALLVASNRHDMNMIRVFDRRDYSMPDVGLLKIRDAETGERIWVDTALPSVRKRYKDLWTKQENDFNAVMTKLGTNNIAIETSGDYVKSLLQLFKH